MVEKRENLGERTDKWFTLNRGTAHPEIFTSPKIVAPQRSKLNTFGYNELSWYASADVYYITSTDESTLDLKYALGILNSKLYFLWLYLMGKRKGEALELYQKPLSEVPIKDVNIKQQEQVIKQVEILIHGHDDHAWNKLNDLIFKIYDITDSEIEAINRLYDEKSKSKIASNVEEKESDAA
jgi:adenine-specific DNA-methyltransferase